MLDNMEAMLSHVRGACSAKCPASVQLHFTAQMIQTRPLDSDFYGYVRQSLYLFQAVPFEPSLGHVLRSTPYLADTSVR